MLFCFQYYQDHIAYNKFADGVGLDRVTWTMAQPRTPAQRTYIISHGSAPMS